MGGIGISWWSANAAGRRDHHAQVHILLACQMLRRVLLGCVQLGQPASRPACTQNGVSARAAHDLPFMQIAVTAIEGLA